MLFSIIVPIYNSEKYLAECLDSLAAQTFRDFEVILVDDGSTDSSAEICCSYEYRFPSVVFIHKENAGRLLARHDGAASSSGEYLLFVDSDDRLHEDALEECVDAIKNDHPDVIAFLDTADDAFNRGENRVGLRRGLYASEAPCELKMATCGGNFNSMCGKAIKRSVIDLNETWSDYKSVIFAEDLLYFLPIADRAQSLYFIDRSLYHYRRHEGNSTNLYNNQQLESLKVAMASFMNYAEKWGGCYVGTAALGILQQYCFLIKILVLSKFPNNVRNAHLREIAAALGMSNPAVIQAIDSARPDNRILLKAVLNGRFRTASAVVYAVDVIKKMRA